MRGHTSNRLLAAALASGIVRSRGEAKRRPDDDPTKEFFFGRADAFGEIAYLMALSDEVAAITDRDVA